MPDTNSNSRSHFIACGRTDVFIDQDQGLLRLVMRVDRRHDLLQLADLFCRSFGTSLLDFRQVTRRTGAFDRLMFRFTNLFRYVHGSNVA
jgi:hypothetical protein